MGFHLAHRGNKGFLELLPRTISHHVGDALQSLVILRQGVALLVSHHLDTVLNIAQIPVCSGQYVHGTAVDPAVPGQCIEPGNGGYLPQLRPPPPRDQLLGLNEEFDFANPAASQFHIVAAHGDFAMSLVGMDLPLDGMDILDGSKVEILAPYEGG